MLIKYLKIIQNENNVPASSKKQLELIDIANQFVEDAECDYHGSRKRTKVVRNEKR